MSDQAIQSEVSGFWDRSAGAFDTRASHVTKAEEWQTVLSAALGNEASKDVVDLGTGTGACALIAARLGHRVRAYDGSEGMLATARNAARDAGLTVDFIQSSIEEADIASGSADIVTIRNVLWTVQDPITVLQKAHRILRPDGFIMLSDGFWATSPDYKVYSAETSSRIPLLEGFTEDVARELLGNCGFAAPQSWHHLFNAAPYGADMTMFVLTARKNAA
jgi:ubiquinone/menaquinone biosynthesis C-methylase UbiE